MSWYQLLTAVLLLIQVGLNYGKSILCGNNEASMNYCLINLWVIFHLALFFILYFIVNLFFKRSCVQFAPNCQIIGIGIPDRNFKGEILHIKAVFV